MDHHYHGQAHSIHRGGEGGGEPARSRWAPKPEQILILESIFNSGMVNPAKDETARIRRLLERFGAVRDANVFYWFQNRRSRSRRRARQLQQACGGAVVDAHQLVPSTGHHARGVGSSSPSLLMQYSQVCGGGVSAAAPAPSAVTAATSRFLNDVDGGDDDLFAISRQMGLMARATDDHQCTYSAAGDGAPQLSYQPAGSTIQVFIDGSAFEVPSAAGALDVAGTFGCDAMLVHSSGEILPVNEHGVLIKSLQMGECYYVIDVISSGSRRAKSKDSRSGSIYGYMTSSFTT